MSVHGADGCGSSRACDLLPPSSRRPSVPAPVPKLARDAWPVGWRGRWGCLRGWRSLPPFFCHRPSHPPRCKPALLLTSFPCPGNFSLPARFYPSAPCGRLPLLLSFLAQAFQSSLWVSGYFFFFFLPLEMSLCPLKHITWAGSQEPVHSHAQPSAPADCLTAPSLPCQIKGPPATCHGLPVCHRLPVPLKEPFPCSHIHPGSGCKPGGCTYTEHQGCLVLRTREPVCLPDAIKLPSTGHGHPESHAVHKGWPTAAPAPAPGEFGQRKNRSCLPGLRGERLCKDPVPRT